MEAVSAQRAILDKRVGERQMEQLKNAKQSKQLITDIKISLNLMTNSFPYHFFTWLNSIHAYQSQQSCHFRSRNFDGLSS
jgi:hypothetical protein